MRKENLRDIFGIKGGLNVIFLIETSRNTIFNLFIEWKIHSYNVIQIFLSILYFLKRIISLDSLLEYIEHARIFFRFRKTYRTLSHGSQTRNCEKLVEICIARHMPGLTRPRTFASGTIPLSLPRLQVLFARRRFTVGILSPVNDLSSCTGSSVPSLSPPAPFLEMRQRRGGAWGASKCIEIYEPTPPLPSNPKPFERLMPRFLRLNFALQAWKILPSYPPPYVKYKVYEYALWGTLAMNGLIDFERERERLVGYLESNVFRNLIVYGFREIGTRE